PGEPSSRAPPAVEPDGYSLTRRGEDTYRIAPAHPPRLDPAEAADECAEQKRNGCERNQIRQAQNERERATQKFTAADEPPSVAFMQRKIGGAVLINLKPNPKRCLNRRDEKSKDIERRDSMTEQFEQRSSRSQSPSAVMDRQENARQKPRGNHSGAKQNSRVGGEQDSQTRRAADEETRKDL